jgi:hypothetical protein
MRRNHPTDGMLLGILHYYEAAKAQGVPHALDVVAQRWNLARSTVHLRVRDGRRLRSRQSSLYGTLGSHMRDMGVGDPNPNPQPSMRPQR